MNIICNNCVGGRIYQQLNKQYNNPFIWNIIFYDSYKKLISNIESIKFDEFDSSIKRTIINSPYASILIDNSIEIHYIHYIQNSKFNIPTKQNNGVDIYYNDILSYANDKYLSRIKRMSLNDNIFILVDDEKVNLTDEQIIDFLKVKIDGVKILVTNKEYFNTYDNYVNILVINETNTNYIAKQLINKYPEIFHE